MSESLLLTLLSPERRLVENVCVEEVTLPGSEGQIEILPGHAAMIGILEAGIFSFKVEGSAPVTGVISSGFFEVEAGKIQVMAETLELKHEIDVSRALKAQQLAEEALKEADLDAHKFKKYQLKLQRSLVRQHIGTENH
jgi:F-type H+-transporting ATPase subunit epsilon